MFTLILNKKYGITNPLPASKANKNGKQILRGLKFGYLVVLGEGDRKPVGTKNKLKRVAICKCLLCNTTIKPIVWERLLSSKVTSCGCDTSEKLRVINTVHGFRKHPIRSVHRNMLDRCYNSKNKRYRYYGGRGIEMCEEWKNDLGAFGRWALTNGYKKGLTIDRIDNEGNYEPNNCRFVDRNIQMNNMSKNLYLEYKGETLTFINFWRKYKKGIKYGTALHRYTTQGMTAIDAVTKPLTVGNPTGPVKHVKRKALMYL